MTSKVALGALLTATILQALDLTIATIALPAIERSFGRGGESGGWILTSYIVAMALMTPGAGALSSAFGRRNALLLAVGGLTLASFACGFSTSFASLLAARVAQGASAGAILPLVQAALLDMTPKAEHGRAMSLLGAAIMVGPVLGPSIGGILVDQFGWRWIFFINLPIGLFALTGIATALDTPRRATAGRTDFAGLAMFGIGIVALQLMLDRGTQAGWLGSFEILGYIILACGGLAAALLRATHVPHAFPSLAPFSDRNFATTTSCSFLAGFLTAGSVFLVPSLLQFAFGESAAAAGIAIAPRAAGTMVMMLLMSRTVGHVDHRLLLLIGVLLNIAALFGLALIGPQEIVAITAALSLLQGIGMGLVFTPLSTAAFAFLPQEQRGEATGMYALVRNIGAGVGVSVLTGLLFGHVDAPHLHAGYRSGFFLLIAVTAVMGLLTIPIRTEHRESSAAAPAASRGRAPDPLSR